ncbi:anthranilate phosphoribosyltransferase [Verrucomicrobiota bacterium]|nr:anthranilate phosphoribosyltransferase [Verrucomicrobiota bacterium]GDY17679.1 anthranilate phosphoribosyltransferase [Verrucomicrobiota bacterium]
MAMDLPRLTTALEAGRDLTSVEAGEAATAMIDGAVSDEAKEAFLLALAHRGETVVEVAAFAHAYRDRARRVDFGEVPDRAIDIVGTGGDRSGSFNISSASSLIVAAAGVPVLKHGNRSITSKSGSADFLAGLGVELEASDAQLRRAVSEAGFCYLYAPAFHPAFKAVLGVRKRLAERGSKTLFNILGPLINPARPAYMMVGVYAERWVEPMAAALGELGVRRGLVVHGLAAGGMDELTTAGETRVRGCGELGHVDGIWLPGDFGFPTCPVADLRGGSPEENLALFSDLLVGGVPDGLLDTLCLSAGAALWVAGQAANPAAGATQARAIVLGGALREQVRRLRAAYRLA